MEFYYMKKNKVNITIYEQNLGAQFLCYLETNNEIVAINNEGFIVKIQLNDYTEKEYRIVHLDVKAITV